MAVTFLEEPLPEMPRECFGGQLAEIEAGLFAELGQVDPLAALQAEHDPFAGAFYR